MPSRDKPRNRGGGRPRRIGELLQRELAVLIQRELSDPRVGPVTLTSVDVAPDMSHAKVYVTQLGGAARAPEVIGALNRAAGFLRHALRGRVELRVIPELRFHYDESVERGANISRLIDQARAQDSDKHSDQHGGHSDPGDGEADDGDPGQGR